MLLIVLVSPLEVVKCWLQLTVGENGQICVPLFPLCVSYTVIMLSIVMVSPLPRGRSQAVCNAVQELCEPNCSRQWAGSAGRSGAHP